MSKWHTLIDMAGKRINKLLVIKRIYPIGKKGVYWLCKCECGNEVEVRGSHLREGQKQCSGCRPHNYNITHGLNSHPLYATWSMMKQRCLNPKAFGYANYGGRGIKVCKRWMDFENFVKDVGLPPTPEHTLDRKKNNGNYTPINWKWSTNKEQKRNTSYNRIIKYNNSEKSLAEWCEILNLRYCTIHARLSNGWNVERAFTQPIKIIK